MSERKGTAIIIEQGRDVIFILVKEPVGEVLKHISKENYKGMNIPHTRFKLVCEIHNNFTVTAFYVDRNYLFTLELYEDEVGGRVYINEYGEVRIAEEVSPIQEEVK